MAGLHFGKHDKGFSLPAQHCHPDEENLDPLIERKASRSEESPVASDNAPMIQKRPLQRRRSINWVSTSLWLALLFGSLIAAGVAWQRRDQLAFNMRRPAFAETPATESEPTGLASPKDAEPSAGPSTDEEAMVADSGSEPSVTQPAQDGGEEIEISPDVDLPEVPADLFITDAPLQTVNRIDEIVLSKLEEMDIPPARPCSDAVFLRRVYLDVIGTLPTLAEAQRFLDDPSPDKRSRLIDELMERPEFADYWAMKWCDILRVKAEFPIKLWPNAAQAYHHWIRSAIKQNMPYDQFVFELLTSSGSNFRTPQVNFYRAVQSKNPQALAQATALTFLCERTDHWPEERLQGFRSFFSKVGYKPTGEWKEEIVFFDLRQGSKQSEGKPLTARFPNGEPVTIPAEQDPREILARWLIEDPDSTLSRAVANRLWYWLHGRGIVEPADDMRPDNPAVYPELLDFLAKELVDSGYDLRHLYRLILNSQTYQLSCLPASDHPEAGKYLAYYPIRRLDAEVLIDAICQITGTHEVYSSIIPEPFTFLPDHQRAIALPDGSITSAFLEMFGRPARDTGLLSERNNHLSAAQALHLLNSNHIRNKIKSGAWLSELMTQSNSPEVLYLTILSRRPTDSEYERVLNLCVYGRGRDVAWALMNSDEFLFRH